MVYNSAAGELVAISQALPGTLTTGQAPVPLVAVVLNDTGNGGGVVTWANNCGGPDCGSFSITQTSSGETTYYTPPASVPAPSGGSGTVTITAAAKDDSAAVASENVTITGNLGDVTVAWSTPPTELDVGAQSQIAATVSNANDLSPTVLYSCSPSGSCGTFTPPGGQPGPATAPSGVNVTYTAPASVPSGGTATISATSNDDPIAAVSGTVTIVSVGQNSLLNGQYAFSVSGISASGGFYTAVGSVTLSNGVVTAGEEDYYDGAANNDINFSIVVGPNSQYSIDPNGDGRGSLTLETGQNSVGALGIQTFSLTVVNTPQHALITELDSSATSSGSLDL